MEYLYALLRSCVAHVEQNVNLSGLTSFHIGGKARYFVRVETEKELQDVLRIAVDNDVNVCVLGGGSNVLLSDSDFDGIVLHIHIGGVLFDDTHVEVGSGVVTAQLAGQCIARGLVGLEWAVGIPGKVGGAVVGNAGAMGGEMKDVVQRVRSIHVKTLEIKERDNEQCAFGYRESVFKSVDEVIVSVGCVLKHGDKDVLQAMLRDNLSYRNTTQPKRFGSSGCMFKNVIPRDDRVDHLRSLGVPESMLENRRISAGWLIDRAGCKGLRVGDAMVSAEHGNFIINCGHATSGDVREVVRLVQQAVLNIFGLELEMEVRYIG